MMTNPCGSRSAWLAACAAALLGLGACDDMPSGPATPDALRTASAADERGIRPEEAEFFALEREIPGFGGYAFDESGNLVAHVRELAREREPAARRRLGEIARSRRAGLRGRNGAVILRPGKFAFSELADARDQLTDALLGKNLGVRSTDADEARNRVVVGVKDARSRVTVVNKMAELGISPDMVQVVEEDDIGLEEIGPAPRQPSPGYLNSDDTYDLVRGGLPVYWITDGVTPVSGYSSMTCTVGFYAYRNGVKVGVSNSHCSRDMNSGGGDGTEYYNRATQLSPNTTHFDQYLGSETHDRGYYDYCGKWYNPFRWCRRADAMLFTVSANAPASAVGFIARPTLLNPGRSDNYQYHQISASNPSFRIVARNYSRSGETVNKVGSRTGWTSGSITATCKDVDMLVIVTVVPQPVKKCQHEASYGRDGGDSGGPVFVLDANGNADLRGIHWGHYPQMTGFKTVFSSLGGIEADLGGLQVLAPAAPAPPPSLSVSIAGPYQLQAYDWGRWTASGAHGLEPYTYKWWRGGDLVGTGDAYVAQMGTSSFALNVEITDATGEVSYAETWVYPLCASENAPGGTSPAVDQC